MSLLGAALALPAVEPAFAQAAPERAVASIKWLDYLDSQPDAKRIRVRSPAVSLVAPIAGDWSVGSTLVSDAISGASPAHHTTSLKKLTDQRHALDASVTRHWASTTVTVGVNFSKEADYLSRGVSVQASRWSDDKNTSWTAGIGLNNDAINPTNGAVENERKHVADWLLGVTQVFSTHDIAQLNLGYSQGRGYFSDPYKVFDKRPRERDHHTLLARWNHHVESSQSTLRLSYRHYGDNYRIKAHTFGAEFVQPLAQGWTVTPHFRLYTQSAARFYVNADPNSGPFAPNPPQGAVFFTEDQRMSAFGARTVGIKVAKQFSGGWLMDAKYERYAQRAAWRLFGSGSPGLAPFNARSLQLGLSHQF